ncbi:outer membrane protein assembly factor BamD [Aliidiomarina shirensis]|uniref:Outer membrane protein assembly factor BamD n=1 Tax=Aliidiomarina shirensis TaxID=1048642 RepID=A0A432WQM7_9GAMM|nr:outer membrane protein assembly factor BamD [Aliidiomarina shirensis]RUO36068.1 outer membrane protein assembly factor BamD [Aliidiomarina shirensis]
MRVVLSIAICAVLFLSGCSSRSDDNIQRSELENLYELSQDYLQNGRFADAATLLSQINARYPFGPYAQQIQLDLIYAQYKVGRQDQALTVIDRFLSLNPNHADNDYVRYMRGLVHLQAEGAFFQDVFGVDRSDRNPVYAERAFDDFAELVQRHPDSKYAADARQRMVWIQSRLAKHELAAAEYYLRREAYMAAARRSVYIVENFPNVIEAKRALEIMVASYEALDLTQEANDAQQVLNANF